MALTSTGSASTVRGVLPLLVEGAGVIVYVTGPVRSGKSAYAVRLARQSGGDIVYVATAAPDPDDSEWRGRLERHARERPPEWRTVETAGMSHDAVLRIFGQAEPPTCLLVDALGTWLAQRIGAHIDLLEVDYAVLESMLDREAGELVEAILAARTDVIVVSEQVGWDVVPVAQSARLFRDVLGRMGQRLARRSDRAYLVVAGFALDLRATGVDIASPHDAPP
jgi:adenosyl cobinamide kinase/adenosyl cobinamide phosphate guanylyltransferase